MIAQYFGVDSNYLLNDNTQTQPTKNTEAISPDLAELAEICDQLSQTRAGVARLQLLLEEAQRLLEEANIQEEKRKNLTK